MKKEENITTNPDTNIIEKKAKSSKAKNVSAKTENKEILLNSFLSTCLTL